MDIDAQPCQTCQRLAGSSLPLYCHRCARDIIYEPRLRLAQGLLAKESLGNKIGRTSIASRDGNEDVKSDQQTSEVNNKLSHDAAQSEYRLIAARTQSILDDSRQLQGEIEKMRAQLAELRAGLSKRRRSLKSAVQEIEYEEESSVKAAQQDITSAKASWDRLHKRIVNGRHVLPRELVSLYGLQTRRRRKGSSSRDTFVIAGVPVFNLKELNSATPEILNASTYHVAHIIHLSAHYLGLRLPAEMSLATAGQPLTFIYPPMSSYKTPSLNFGLREVPAAKFTARKRVLHLEKPLPQLASEDSQAYSLYLDAIILLAWNVAWVAKTQGIDVGGKGWEDICLVGKNLWDLFGETAIGTDGGFDVPSPSQTTGIKDSEVRDHPSLSSQASSHSFLNSAGPGGSAEYMKSWRYSTPTRIIETIKSALMNERMGADWEVLEMPEEEAAAQESNGLVIAGDNPTKPSLAIGTTDVSSPAVMANIGATR